MEFRNKLSLAVLTSGTIALVSLALAVYMISYGSIVGSESVILASIADQASDDTNHLLHEKERTALTLANAPILRSALVRSNLFYEGLSTEEREKSIALLNEKWRATQEPTDTFILKYTDNAVSHFLKSQQALLKGEYGEIFLTNRFGALVSSTSKLSTFAHGHKYWWLGAYNGGVGAVFFDDRGYDDSVGGYVLGLVVPVRRDSEIIGILKCNLNILGSISELLSTAKDRPATRFKLARSGGMVVFEDGAMPLSTQVHPTFLEMMRDRNREPLVIDEGGVEYLAGLSEIALTMGGKRSGFGGTFESIDHKKGNTGESWYVICYQPMSRILAPIIESVKTVVFSGAMIILVLVFISQRFGRKIQIVLRESEENLRTTLNSIGDAVIVTDADGRITSMNPVAEQLTGWDGKDAKDRPLAEVFNIVGAETGKRAESPVQKVVEQGKIVGLANHTMLIARDNYKYQIADSAAPILDDDGTIVGVVLVFRDVTGQYRIQEALRKSEGRYRLLFETMAEGLCLHEIVYNEAGAAIDYTIADVNPAYELITDLKKETAVGCNASELYQTSEPPFMDIYAEVAETGTRASFEVFWPPMDKHLLISAVSPERGKFATVFTDITERKQAEEELRESRQEMELVLWGADLGTWDTTLPSGVKKYNKRYAEMLGYTIQELEALAQLEVDVHPDDLQRTEEAWDTHAGGKADSFEVEYRMRHKSGHWVWVLSRGRITSYDDDGNPLRASGTHLDITERKTLETQLQQAHKMEAIGTLAGGIAHDFNNYLSIILGNISLAKTYADKNEDLLELLVDAAEGVKRAESLTQQLITFSKGGAPIKQTLDIAGLMRESCRFPLSGSNVTCDYQMPDGLPVIEADPGQLNQVFSNLIINATQAMPEGGTIQIRARTEAIEPEDPLPLAPGNYVSISIQDHGIGISESHLAKVFDLFYTTKQKGRGIGLSSVFSIITNHDGHIAAESQVGEGSTFHIYLPVSDQLVVESDMDQPADYQGGGKILVMDDEDAIRRMVGRTLERLGYQVTGAADGSEAIELYREAWESEEPFDAVILDLTIPGGMGGKEAIGELREINPDVKAIVSSGYSNDPVMSDFSGYGFSGAVPKPFDPEKMASTLHEILTRNRD